MTTCITCGEALHPERAKRYAYCTRKECRERNAKPLEIVAVGVNKAADQYIVLDARAKREIEAGRYKRRPEGAPGATRKRPRPNRKPASTATPAATSRTAVRRPRWSKAQQDLALIYRDRGMKPDEIASTLGVSRYLVTQMLLAATNKGKP